jgi:hypothetical protein
MDVLTRETEIGVHNCSQVVASIAKYKLANRKWPGQEKYHEKRNVLLRRKI